MHRGKTRKGWEEDAWEQSVNDIIDPKRLVTSQAETHSTNAASFDSDGEYDTEEQLLEDESRAVRLFNKAQSGRKRFERKGKPVKDNPKMTEFTGRLRADFNRNQPRQMDRPQRDRQRRQNKKISLPRKNGTRKASYITNRNKTYRVS